MGQLEVYVGLHGRGGQGEREHGFYIRYPKDI